MRGSDEEEVVPLVLALGLEEVSVAGGGLDGGCLVEARGPVGGARSLAGFEGGLRDRGGLEDRGGVRVRVRAEVWSLRGERERERRDGGSSAAIVSLPVPVGISPKCTNLAATCACLDSGCVPYLSYLSPHLALHPYAFALLFPSSGSAPYEASLAGLEIDSCFAASP